MKKDQFKIVGLGEVLFDILPNNKKMLGGAPANFAYVCDQLGNRGIVASRVGKDDFGEDVLVQLSDKNIDISHIQTDLEHQTGSVRVKLQNGQPDYEIVENVAWDFLEFTKAWKNLAETCDAVCFGSLAQRNLTSRKTIQKFLAHTKADCLKVFDINLRQKYFSKEIIQNSLETADVLKLNHEELPQVVEFFSIKGSNNEIQIKNLLEKFGLKLVCLTLGEEGSILLTNENISKHKGIKVKVADTIGAGDAFTATLTHGLLSGWDLDEINEKACRIAGFVASKNGAMPVFKDLQFDQKY